MTAWRAVCGDCLKCSLVRLFGSWLAAMLSALCLCLVIDKSFTNVIAPQEEELFTE